MPSPLYIDRLGQAVLLAGLLSLNCAAQQPESPSLNDILVRMQANLSDYLHNVPNFFCDERVDSRLQQPGASEQKTVTDSIFRLRRSVTPTDEWQFSESREIKTVNKQVAKGEDIQGPAIFSGAFTNAAAVVSLELSHCYDYNLIPDARLGKSPVLLVEFATQESAIGDKSCPTSERETGRAWIDPNNFHLLRVEARIPNHEAVDGILALWTWEIEYAPVTFDSRQFWMPKTIASKAEANDNRAVWSFTANYRNYHKLTVTSHIITDVDKNPPSPPQ
ncbi:MAG TPA: hypothetical protein VL495_04895 [Edaphobacter sp.]|nr:hypothetical protein [Edaphobacter sp.]